MNIASFTLSHPQFSQYKYHIIDLLKAGLITLCELNDPQEAQQLSNLLMHATNKKFAAIITCYQHVSHIQQCATRTLCLLYEAVVKTARSVRHNGIKKTWNIFFRKIGYLNF